MLADLDLLLTAVFCAADDLLPKRAGNARRRITDAEVVTLCVAQAVLAISSDRRFLRAARRQLAGLFSVLPTQDAYWKRRARLAEQIERLMAAFARDCPGLRPARKTEPDNGRHLSSIRQRIESIFWTLKDQLGLEGHRARTLHGLRARIASNLPAYSAGIWLTRLTGRPSRAFADLTA